MWLIVRMSDGSRKIKTLENVAEDSTIQELRQAIKDEFELSMETVPLSVNKVMLEDGKNCKHYNIESGTRIMIEVGPYANSNSTGPSGSEVSYTDCCVPPISVTNPITVPIVSTHSRSEDLHGCVITEFGPSTSRASTSASSAVNYLEDGNNTNSYKARKRKQIVFKVGSSDEKPVASHWALSESGSSSAGSLPSFSEDFHGCVSTEFSPSTSRASMSVPSAVNSDEMSGRKRSRRSNEGFKVDFPNVKNKGYNAWFQGQILNVCHRPGIDEKEVPLLCFADEENETWFPISIFMHVHENETLPIMKVQYWRAYAFANIQVNGHLTLSYDLDDPENIGPWYSFVVSDKSTKNGIRYMTGDIMTWRTVFQGHTSVKMKRHGVLKDCHIRFSDETDFETEENMPPLRKVATELSPDKEPSPKDWSALMCSETIEIEENDPLVQMERYAELVCATCKSLENIRCVNCGCSACGSKDVDMMVFCEKCSNRYHFWCIKQNMTEQPDGMWMCSDCRR